MSSSFADRPERSIRRALIVVTLAMLLSPLGATTATHHRGGTAYIGETEKLATSMRRWQPCAR